MYDRAGAAAVTSPSAPPVYTSVLVVVRIMHHDLACFDGVPPSHLCCCSLHFFSCLMFLNVRSRAAACAHIYTVHSYISMSVRR